MSMRPGSARPGSARPGSARPGSARVQRPPTAAGPPGTRVQVAVRVRPFNASDQGDTTENVYLNPEDATKKSLIAVDETARGARSFTYDHVFNGGQEEVFSTLGLPMLEEAYKGFNVCLFAYGQTGSGKTYSVQGSDSPDADPSDDGLVPRFVQELFAQAQAKVEADPDLTIKVTMSFVEIYMEKVRDLLATRRGAGGTSNTVPGQQDLELREDPSTRRVFVQDLGVHSVLSVARVKELLRLGNSHRQKAETKMNEFSSRSHSILQFTVSQTSESGEKRDVVSDIRLVDLAGSERQSKSEASGMQLEEAKKINHSLLQLGRALNSFSEGRNEFLSLRESKLTRLLSDCFGGNSKTWMLATVAPSSYNVAESISTLEYATNAKKITNKAVVNKVARLLELKELKDLSNRLEAAIAAERKKVAQLEEENSTLESEYAELYESAKAIGEEDARGRLSTLERSFADAIEENDTLRLELTRLEEEEAAAEGYGDAALLDEGDELAGLSIAYTGTAVLSLRNLFQREFEFVTLVLNSNPAADGTSSALSSARKSSNGGTPNPTVGSTNGLNSGRGSLSAGSSSGHGGLPPMLNVFVSLIDTQEADLISVPKGWEGKELVQLQVRIVSVQNLPASVTTGSQVHFHFKRQEKNVMTTFIEKENPQHARFDFRQQVLMGPRCAAMEDLFSCQDVLRFTVLGFSATEEGGED